jgi:hypothetical protein
MPATSTHTQYPASDKQRGFARRLADERPQWHDSLQGDLYERAFDLIADPSKFVSSTEASRVIDALLALPRPPAPGQATEPGVYVLPDGTIVKLQANKAKTSVYSLRWVEITGDRVVDDSGEWVKGDWTYDPDLKAQVHPDQRMTLEAAKAFILRYGRCVRCSRRLKAAESVERGIGPVCVDYFTFGTES